MSAGLGLTMNTISSHSVSTLPPSSWYRPSTPCSVSSDMVHSDVSVGANSGSMTSAFRPGRASKAERIASRAADRADSRSMTASLRSTAIPNPRSARHELSRAGPRRQTTIRTRQETRHAHSE